MINKITYKNIYLFILVIFCFIFIVCQNTDETYTSQTKSGGVIFTFDDESIDQWFDLHNYLKHTNWKATFFVSGFEGLNNYQINKLKELQQFGHEIGGHGLNHINARDYVRENGISAYLENEIYPMKRLMFSNGFELKSFAYPYGVRNTEIDNVLFDEFLFIRGTTYGRSNFGFPSPSCFFNNERLIYGLGIDESYGNSTFYLKLLLEHAKLEGKIVVFYAHIPKEIITGDYQIDYLRMLELCNYINENNLEFYTVSDLYGDL